MKPITEMSMDQAAGIRFVLMDIDDTLTTNGKLTTAAYNAMWQLHDAGLKVIPITGRPAGWCDLIVREWPVDGVVGENGALVFWESRNNEMTGVSGTVMEEFHPNAIRNDHPVLQKVKDRVITEVPGIRLAKDQFSRLFDIALDFAEEDPVLPLSAAERVKAIALEEGAEAKISSIHVNVWMGNYNKLSMAERFLQKVFDWQSCQSRDYQSRDDYSVLFVGDSPNDEPMFARFPLACGVANINRYKGLIQHLPAFVSQKESGEGFAEITETLLSLTTYIK